MRIAHSLGILSLVMLGGVGFYLFAHPTPLFFSTDQSTQHLLLQPIETYIEQGQLVRFGKNGFKKEQLYLHTAYHIKEHSITHISQPKLMQLKQNKWITLSAKQAQATHIGSNGQIQKIVFNNDVCLNHAPFELNTSTLTYLPESELAKTDALINISSENMHIQAKGMTIHLSSGKMELLKQVTSKYELNSI